MTVSSQIVVSLPPILRPFTSGRSYVECQGTTVGEVLRALSQQFPEIGRRIMIEQTEVRRFVNVYLDDEDVRALDGLETSVERSSTITILLAVAGG